MKKNISLISIVTALFTFFFVYANCGGGGKKKVAQRATLFTPEAALKVKSKAEEHLNKSTETMDVTIKNYTYKNYICDIKYAYTFQGSNACSLEVSLSNCKNTDKHLINPVYRASDGECTFSITNKNMPQMTYKEQSGHLKYQLAEEEYGVQTFKYDIHDVVETKNSKKEILSLYITLYSHTTDTVNDFKVKGD